MRRILLLAMLVLVLVAQTPVSAPLPSEAPTFASVDAGVIRAGSVITNQLDAGVIKVESVIAQQIDAGTVLTVTLFLSGTTGAVITLPANASKIVWASSANATLEANTSGNLFGGTLDVLGEFTPGMEGIRARGTNQFKTRSHVADGTTAYLEDVSTDLTTGFFKCLRDANTNALVCVTFDGIWVVQAGGAQAKKRGTIAIGGGGTGTATVGTGCFAQCTNQTNLNAYKCIVSGTTLTATGTSGDTVTYSCEY